MLEFLREQFQARPSSGNITVSEHRGEKRKADETEIKVSENNPDSDLTNISIEEIGENIDPDETQFTEPTPPVATTTSSSNNAGKAFTHTNDFRKRTGKQDQIQKLLQLEEKKISILEAKTARKQEHESTQNKSAADEDDQFFESLKPHLKLITGMNKLMFRNDVQNLVMKYAYGRREFDSSSRSTTVSGSGDNSYTLFNFGDATGVQSGVETVWRDNITKCP